MWGWKLLQFSFFANLVIGRLLFFFNRNRNRLAIVVETFAVLYCSIEIYDAHTAHKLRNDKFVRHASGLGNPSQSSYLGKKLHIHDYTRRFHTSLDNEVTYPAGR